MRGAAILVAIVMMALTAGVSLALGTTNSSDDSTASESAVTSVSSGESREGNTGEGRSIFGPDPEVEPADGNTDSDDGTPPQRLGFSNGVLKIGAFIPEARTDEEGQQIAAAMHGAVVLASEEIRDGVLGAEIVVEIITGDEGTYGPSDWRDPELATDRALATTQTFLNEGVDVVVGGVGPGAASNITQAITSAGLVHFRIEEALALSGEAPLNNPELAILGGSGHMVESQLLSNHLLENDHRRIAILAPERDADAAALASNLRDLFSEQFQADTSPDPGWACGQPNDQAEGDSVVPDATPISLAVFHYSVSETCIEESVDAIGTFAPDTVLVVGGFGAPGSNTNGLGLSGEESDGSVTTFSDSPAVLRALKAQGIADQADIYLSSAEATRELKDRMSDDPEALAGVFGIRTQGGFPAEFVGRLSDAAPGEIGSYASTLVWAAELYDAILITALAGEAGSTDDPERIAQLIPTVTIGGIYCDTYRDCRTQIALGRSAEDNPGNQESSDPDQQLTTSGAPAADLDFDLDLDFDFDFDGITGQRNIDEGRVVNGSGIWLEFDNGWSRRSRLG